MTSIFKVLMKVSSVRNKTFTWTQRVKLKTVGTVPSFKLILEDNEGLEDFRIGQFYEMTLEKRED